MKPTGPREERETIIRWSEADNDATLWTASSGIYKRMLRLGWQPSDDSERHAEFVVPTGRVRLPRQLSKARSEAVKARQRIRKDKP